MSNGNCYLAHHGVKGQKWGVRRYQNDDGSLTALGKQRYGSRAKYESDNFRKWMAPELRDKYSIMKLQEHHNVKKAVRARKLAQLRPNNEALNARAEKLERKAEGLKARNANRKAYAEHISTGELMVQNYLGSYYGGAMFRESRARGDSYVQTALSLTVPYYTIMQNRDTYGKYLMLN